MAEAIKLAKRAAGEGEVPVGAVVVKDGELLGEGWNQPIGHNDPTAHAEIAALRNAAQHLANYRIPGTTLYVTMEPCTMCFGAIVHARVERLVYGAYEPKAGVISSNTHLMQSPVYNHVFSWDGGVCEEECSQLIQDFFRMRRAQKKADKNSD